MLWSLLFILLIGACECSNDTVICPGDVSVYRPRPNWISSQSSNQGNNNAEKAVDGKKETCTKKKSWWMIDLQGVNYISSIAIYNKQNNKNICGAQIYIGNSSGDNSLTNKLVTNITNLKEGWNIYQTNTSGRYINVSHPEKEDFSLCEVRINGTKKDFPFKQCKPWITSQSSDYEEGNIPFISDRAIDGDEIVCAHTKDEEDSWWMVDLQGVYDISSIAIYNIVQDNYDMTGVRIHIGYSSKNNGTDNKLVTNITGFKKGCWNVYQTKTSGRFITVSLPEKKLLILCEVKINATKKKSPFKLITRKMTWENALEHCRANHRDLASILGEEDQAWAELEVKEAGTDYVWLGLHYTCVLEFWFWVADYPLDFHHWAPEGKNEDCDISVAMKKIDDHQWFSKSVQDKFNFLCEKRNQCFVKK